MKRLLTLTFLMLWTMNLFACASPSFFGDDTLGSPSEDIPLETTVTYGGSLSEDWYLNKSAKSAKVGYDSLGRANSLHVSVLAPLEPPGDDALLLNYSFVSYNRYTDSSSILKFKLDGRDTIVVIPDEPLEGNPTVWRTEFFEAFDTVDKALLKKGWHIVYHSVSDMYGAPESLVLMREFYDFASLAFGLSRNPVMFGFSRGGLYAVNYAAAYPDAVGGIYLDAPVQDIRDWPCRDDMKGSRERNECMQIYGLTDETLPYFDGNTYEKAEEIAHIPLIIVAGLADTTVVWEKNGAITAERVKAAGGNVKTILKEDCDHHPHSLDDPTPVVEFIEKYCM